LLVVWALEFVKKRFARAVQYNLRANETAE